MIEEEEATVREAKVTSSRVSPKKEGGERRTLQNFIALGVQGVTSSIVRPNVEAHNFEFKLTLISRV